VKLSSTALRELVLQGLLDDVRTLLPRVKGHNSGTKRFKKFTVGELKILEALMTTIINFMCKPSRSINLMNMSLLDLDQWLNDPKFQLVFSQNKGSVKLDVMVLPGNEAAREWLLLYRTHIRPLLLRGGRNKLHPVVARAKLVHEVDRRKAASLIQLPVDQFFRKVELPARVTAAGKRGKDKWRAIFLLAGPWSTKDLTEEELRLAVNMFNNHSMLVTAAGDPMNQGCGLTLRFVTGKYAGPEQAIGELQLRKLVTTEAKASGDKDLLDLTDSMMEHTADVSRKHYQLQKRDDLITQGEEWTAYYGQGLDTKKMKL
jgi:hypothetical protein